MSSIVPGPLAADARTALSNLVFRACESSMESQGTAARTDALRQATEALNTAVKDTLLHLSHSSNDAAPINQLPRELFLQILLHLSLRDRICSTRVCSHWRIVALGFPNLWSDFKGGSTSPGGLDAAASILARSGTAPLSLHLFTSDSCDALADILRQHIHHTRTLTLLVDFEFTRGDKAVLILPLLRALEKPAPMLENFTLRLNRLPRIPNADIYVLDELFAHAAPALRAVRLSGVALRMSRPFPALSAVRVLSLGQLEIDLLHIIEMYPHLEQLQVSMTSLVSSTAQHVTAHNLGLLNIHGKFDAATIITTQVTCVKPLQVWMDLADEDLLRYILTSAPKRSLRRVRLYIYFPILSRHLELAYDTGMTWVLGPTVGTRITQLVLQDGELMSGVTHFALHELHWPLQLPELTLPRLQKLDVVLDSFAEPMSTHMTEFSLQQHAGLFYEWEDAPSVLNCPMLEELHISYPTRNLALLDFAAPILSVDVHDIYRFVATRLRCGRLRLVLRNVHLEDPTRGAGMQALTDIVEGIEYRVVESLTVPELHRAGNMMTWAYSMYE